MTLNPKPSTLNPMFYLLKGDYSARVAPPTTAALRPYARAAPQTQHKGALLGTPKTELQEHNRNIIEYKDPGK